jgi:glutamine synthetase
MTDQSLPDDVEWVSLDFVDLFGGNHALHLPAARFAEVAKHGTPFDGSAIEGRARSLEADMLLMPDTATLTPLGDGLARVVCTARTIDGRPWVCDPRVALQVILDRLDEFAASATVAAELEFYLLTDDDDPIDGGGYYAAEEGVGIRVTRAAAAKLAQSGVPVDGCHSEAGPGQYELDLAARAPLELADALAFAQQVVRDEAAEAGVVATFMARPLEDEAGSGLHLHQRAGDHLLAGKGELTDDGRAFVAGQLRHAKALSALAAPTVNSYKRLHSGPEAPSAAVWARYNRGALIRVSSLRDREASIEYRGADPSANPYLLLGALLTAGADGLEAGIELPPPSEEDTMGGYDPAAASIRFDPLPRDLDDALDALVADDVLADAFDGQLLGRLVDGRRAEAAEYRSRVTPWELDRYLGHRRER